METPEKIYNLSEKEILLLIRDSFQKLNLKFTLNPEQTTAMIKDIYHYQGRLMVEEFTEAFSLFAAGELKLESKYRASVSSMFIGVLTKAYKEKKYGKREVVKRHSEMSDEDNWNRFLKHILFYHSIPNMPDWISLYNHCIFKKWITGNKPIEKFTNMAYKLAEKDVMAFVDTNWGETITNANVFNGGNTGLVGIGTKMRDSLLV